MCGLLLAVFVAFFPFIVLTFDHFCWSHSEKKALPLAFCRPEKGRGEFETTVGQPGIFFS
jgi:hypothetical protein